MNWQRAFPKYCIFRKCYCQGITTEAVGFPCSLSQGSFQRVPVPHARMEEPVSMTDRVLSVPVATPLEEPTVLWSWWTTIPWVWASTEFSSAIQDQSGPLPQGLITEHLLVRGLTFHFNEWQLKQQSPVFWCWRHQSPRVTCDLFFLIWPDDGIKLAWDPP